MGNRRQLKKERSQMFQLLADTYTEHKALDQLHEIGKDKNCQICKRYNATTTILKRLEAELDGTDIPAGEVDPKKTKNRLIIGKIEEEEVLIRYPSITSLKEKIPQFEGRLLKKSEADELLVEVKKDTFVPASRLAESNIGKIAVKAYSERSDECLEVQPSKFILFTGENHEAVISFCKGANATRTKKKNKIQIVTEKGSVSVGPGEVVLRNVFNYYSVYTVEEFDYLYKINGDLIWKAVND